MAQPTSIDILPADPADAPMLSDLARRAKAAWGYPEAWLQLWRAELTLTPDDVAEHATFVARVDGRTVGTCVLEDQGSAWSIEHLWVLPAFQRRGIGRAMVEHALRVAAETRPGPVDVVSDPHAERFYRRLGAHRIGAEPAPMPGAPDRALPRLRFRGA